MTVEQRPPAVAVAASESTPLPLHEDPAHSDLRIVPLDYQVPDSTNPLDHHDIRVRLADESE